MTFSPQFDGQALHSDGTVTLSWKDSGPIQIKSSPLLRGGSGISRNALVGREIDLTGIVRASTPTATLALLDNLMKVLHQSGEKVLRITDDRYIDAYADPGSITSGEGTDGLTARWKCRFISTSPYWRDQTELNSTKANDADGVVTDTVSNTGKAPELPDWEFTATGDYDDVTITVENTTTGKQFRLFKVTIKSGDTLVIDSSSGEVYFSGDPASGSAVPKRIDGQFWTMPNGSNTITYTCTQSGTDLTYKVKYTPRHHNLGEWDT